VSNSHVISHPKVYQNKDIFLELPSGCVSGSFSFGSEKMSLKYEKGLKFESWIYILKYETWTTFQGI